MLHSCGKPKFSARGEHHCNLCEYSTFDKTYLQQHLRCHTGERPFSCDQCKYRCGRNANLKAHNVTQTPREKIFVVRSVIVDILASWHSSFTSNQNILKFDIVLH